VRAERLPDIRQSKDVIVRKPWLQAGKPRVLKGQDLAAMGLVSRDRLVTDRKQLAQALDLPPESMEHDPLFGASRRAAIFPFSGKLKPSDVSGMQGKIQEILDRQDINLIILEINSPGGAPEQSMNLANFLRGTVQSGKRRTVAYVTQQAAGDAVFFALACDTIIMLPDSSLGGDGALSAEELPIYADNLAAIAQEKGRSASLAKALIDPQLEVHRYERDDGVAGYFTEADLQRQPDPRRWRQQEKLEKGGNTLTLTPPRAVKLRMASQEVQNYEELKDFLGVTTEPLRVQTTWLDVLLDALRNDWVLSGLLMIGIVAFYAEMNSPGTGVGGLIATFCFLLFFWGKFLDGSANWLEVLMFLVGIVLILIEMFALPGFGIVGLGGVILVFLSLIMAMQTFHGLPSTPADMLELRSSLTVMTLAAIGALAGAALLRRYLPASPVLRELILPPPDSDDAHRQELQGSSARYDHLLGELGIAVTQLTPSGKARIGDELLDVITEGEVINRGEAVVVVETIGSRIVVRAAR
jgi:membrane-bound ClpP family serine protease